MPPHLLEAVLVHSLQRFQHALHHARIHVGQQVCSTAGGQPMPVQQRTGKMHQVRQLAANSRCRPRPRQPQGSMTCWLGLSGNSAQSSRHPSDQASCCLLHPTTRLQTQGSARVPCTAVSMHAPTPHHHTHWTPLQACGCAAAHPPCLLVVWRLVLPLCLLLRPSCGSWPACPQASCWQTSGWPC